MLKLADRWYQRRPIQDGITLIFEPHVHPYLRCNIWHIRGRDRDLLIDTGLGVCSLKDEISDLLDKPLTALATHIHYDHVGCLHEFDDRVMHKVEAPHMATHNGTSWLKMSDMPADYRTNGETEGFDDYLLNALPDETFDIDNYRIRATKITWAVDDGDVVELGNRHFEVFHLPGHSPGSIGLWEAATGTLFSGDALYDGTLLDDLPGSNVDDYIRTMERLRGLPVNAVHGGHEPSFGRERMIELIDAYLLQSSI